MSPELLKQMSVGFLVLGILGIIATVYFSVKYQFFSMILNDIRNKGNKSISDEKEYFEFVENKNKSNQFEQHSLTEGKFSIGSEMYEPPFPESPPADNATVVSPRGRGSQQDSIPEPDNATVVSSHRRDPVSEPEQPAVSNATVVTSHRRDAQPEQPAVSNATVVTSRRRETQPDREQAVNGTVVVSSKRRKAEQSEALAEKPADEFIILEEIMQIHGDPQKIALRCRR